MLAGELLIGSKGMDNGGAGLFETADDGRTGGADGGGGMAGGSGSGLSMVVSAFTFSSPSASPSRALGTISERNSRSSDESANDLCALDTLIELCLRENLLRKRETAEGS